MPPRAPNFQAIALLVSGTFNTLGALWIYADARARRADKPLFAALAMLLLGPLWLAFYMTDRPPLADELHAGSFGWRWMRHFRAAWTASLSPYVAIVIVEALTRGASVAMITLWTTLIFWLAPIVVTAAIGYLLRRRGDVGVDDATGRTMATARARMPLAAVSLAALLLSLALLSALRVRVGLG